MLKPTTFKNESINLLGIFRPASSGHQEVLPKEITRDLDHKAQAYLDEHVPILASSLLTMVEGLGFEIVLYTLYLLCLGEFFFVLESKKNMGV